MRVPAWLIVAAAVVVAFPFAWGLGVDVAFLLLGPEVGAFPVVTILLALGAAVSFAIAPWLTPAKRLAILAAGTVAVWLL